MQHAGGMLPPPVQTLVASLRFHIVKTAVESCHHGISKKAKPPLFYWYRYPKDSNPSECNMPVAKAAVRAANGRPYIHKKDIIFYKT